MKSKLTRATATLFLMAFLATPGISTAIQGGGQNAERMADANKEREPHMAAALEHLHAAQQELEKAAHNKGGHREKALALTNQAIAQVEEGIQYFNRHTGK